MSDLQTLPVSTTLEPRPIPKCRHCQAKPANRHRGLCAACYYLPGVREQYPSTSRRAGAHCVKDGLAVGRSLPPLPTTELPGTPGRVAVLEERARLGQYLHHPDDERGWTWGKVMLELFDGRRVLVPAEGAEAVVSLRQVLKEMHRTAEAQSA